MASPAEVQGEYASEYVTIADARASLGLRLWRMAKLIEETGTQTYRLPVDRRVKWLKAGDVERLAQSLYRPVEVGVRSGK